jgi:hypothetical protein
LSPLPEPPNRPVFGLELIVPPERRVRWLSGPELRRQLADRAADPALRQELGELAGQTLEEL